jgi:DNA-binding NtrC family response regulator
MLPSRHRFLPANSVNYSEIGLLGHVLDMRLGDGSGLQVVEAVREARPDARIVMLTGYGNIATAVAAVMSGVNICREWCVMPLIATRWSSGTRRAMTSTST